MSNVPISRRRPLSAAEGFSLMVQGRSTTLDGIGHSGPRTTGLVLVRPSQRLGSEPFYQEVIAGIETVFAPHEMTLLLQIVSSADQERDTYRRWATTGAVSGVILCDLAHADDRVELLEELEIPTVVVGDPTTAGRSPAVWTDDAASMQCAVQTLVGLGHRTVGRVSGPSALAHTQIRTETFLSVSKTLGVEAINVDADYSEPGGYESTLQLLRLPVPPTVIVYDDDLMALGGLAAANSMEKRVPDDLSIIAWDDSVLCQLSLPKLSVMGHDVQAIGELAADTMLRLLEGEPVHNREAPSALFIARESVAPSSP